MIFTPSLVIELKDNEVFVFGSNSTGFHGAGAAGLAFRGESKNTWRQDKMFIAAMNANPGDPERIGRWAVFGVPRGYQEGHEGKSYAIQTIVRPGMRRSTTKREIYYQLLELSEFAIKNQQLTFLVTKIGCGLAGYTETEMVEVFEYWCRGIGGKVPENIILPEGWDFRKS